MKIKSIKYYKNTVLKIVILLSAFFFAACNATKYVPDGDYLLDKNKIKINHKSIKASDLEDYIQQRPNRKMLSFYRFHLYVYNATHPKKQKKFFRWIGYYKLGDIIGEPPVLLDTAKITKTRKQFIAYLKNRGYYNAVVTDSIYFNKINKKKASVVYFVEPKTPYRINNVKYTVKDLGIRPLIIDSTKKSYLKTGDIFEMEKLDKERNRIIRMLNDSGYYFFNANYIHYEIDSALNSHKVNINLIVEKAVRYLSANDKIVENHRKYTVKSVKVVSPFDLQKSLELKNKYYNYFEKDSLKNIDFLYTKDFLVKPKAIARHIYIEKNKHYSLSAVEETRNHLVSLGTYKVVNINFTPDKNDKNALDCEVLLTPFSSQSYIIEIEGTNSSGNLGVAGSFQYNHKSLFGGAENFSLKFKGAVEAQTAVVGENNNVVPFNTKEIGIESSLRIPIFLLPLKHEKFIRNNAPKTYFSLAYNYQTRPDYIKNYASAGFGYLWKSKKYFKHKFSLIDISAIKVPFKDSLFITEVLDKNIGLKHSFEDQFVSSTGYSIIFSNKNIRKNRNFLFIRYNIETSGNILNTIYQSKNTYEQPYKIFGLRFSQYIKTDIDFRYTARLNYNNSIVYRVFAGIGIPYGNAQTLPYEKQYFSGGANGLRAWVVRSLGPGSYYNSSDVRIYQTSDVKLEGNFEYRFKMFWLLEGALFSDVGNIWAINDLAESDDAKFYADRFYKQLAVDGGFGLRFDFTFFLLRLDWGFKLRDPKEDEDKRWIITQPGYKPFASYNNMINFSIGYPF